MLPHAFGGVLARTRKQQGFPSAHAFYTGRDGRRTLGLTFRNYLNLESGKSLPKPERFLAIVSALGLADHAANARALAEAYLASLGLERVTRLLAGGKSRPRSEDWRLAELAARKALEQTTVQLTAEQWKLRADDYDANTCHLLLLNTAGWQPVPAIARRTGIALTPVKRALRKLAAAGLAEISGEKARSALLGKSVAAPPRTPAMVGVIAALRKHQERWSERGKLLRNAITVVRLSREDLDHLQRHMDQFMDLALLYSSAEPAPDSDIFVLRGQIHRIFEGA